MRNHFNRLLAYLIDWHKGASSFSATLEGNQVTSVQESTPPPGAFEPGFPAHEYRRRWRESGRMNGHGKARRQVIIGELERLVLQTTHRIEPQGGLYAGTEIWRALIIHSPGSTRDVAARFGISQTMVTRLRRHVPQTGDK